MADRAHEWTDEQIKRLNRRLAREYSHSAMEMRTKLNSYLEDYEYANQSWKDAVRSGDATREEYRKWLASQASKRRYVVDMTDMLANDAFNTSQRAFEIINDTIPQVYAENANWAAYSIENGIGRDTGGFALYDQDTVRRLMSMDDDDQVIHEVVPYGPILPEKQRLNLQSLRVEPKKVKFVRWNRQKFTSAITQSILQGESIPNTAKRLAGVLNMDKNMATRAARTAMTSAENAGRVDSYERAKRIGIDLEQEWMATLDERTRASHRLLDGQHVPVGQKFSNGLRFPADPSGDGSEIWNCRCTLVAWLPNIEQEDNQRWSRLPEGMTYEQWKNAKQDERNQGIIDDGNPTELAGVRRGTPMTFDEANELRGNPDYNMAERAGDRYYEANRRVIEYANAHGYDDSEELRRLRAERDEASAEYQRARREQNGYRINCQTCVVANEARRRGYNVEATPNTSGSVNSRVAHNTALAWIDRATGRHPDYIRYDGAGRTDYAGRPIPTHGRFMQWLESDGVVEEGARYTIEFWWKGRNAGGHIISLERTEQGLRMYDPQSGETYTGNAIRNYLRNVKYQSTIAGTTIADAPMLLKVSDYDFDTSICDQILREAR